MRVGITGGHGFLGSHVVMKVLELGWIPVVFTRQQVRDNFSVQTNYSDSELIANFKGLDAVVHLASNRNSSSKIEQYHESQVLTQKVFDACVTNDIKNVVFSSTISIYGGQELTPWNENDLPYSETMYGINKYTSELIANKYSRDYGMTIKNLRLAHLYGFNEKNNYMINLFMRKAFNKKRLVLNTNSTAKREFLYVKDAAKSIIKALEYNKPGTFNIGNSSSVLTNREVAEMINEVFENKNNLIVIDENKEDPSKDSYMNNKLAEDQLKFIADFKFTTAMEEIYSQMKELEYVPEIY